MAASFAGRRILVVEDDYFNATHIVEHLRDAGADVLGPVPTMAEALDVIASQPLDAVVLDIKLRGEMAFPVADVLTARGVPLVLATGYSPEVLPVSYRNIPWCGKPVDVGAIATMLFPEWDSRDDQTGTTRPG